MELQKTNFLYLSLGVLEYDQMRSEILAILSTLSYKPEDKYLFDVEFGLKFYQYLLSLDFFTPLIRNDSGFWRHISLYVIQDIIFQRFGDSPGHFYEKNLRTYPYTLFWYIFLSWQGSVESTEQVLCSSGFNSDMIVQTVERPSRAGINEEFFRILFKKLSNEPASKKMKLLRKVMVLNTAKSLVLIPEYFNGGLSGYVTMLLESCKGGAQDD
ncbi:MAG: hypothetical protein KKE16_02755 [Firmicutes bacterium]|nr:hypothetical protein [Bacillota bacterium]